MNVSINDIKQIESEIIKHLIIKQATIQILIQQNK